MSDARTVIAKTFNAEMRAWFIGQPLPDPGVSADAILAALAEAGLVVVPREPTEKMLDAYGRLRTATSMAFPALCDMEMSPSLWRAMVEAVNEQ